MNAFEILGDPVRRRILELISSGEKRAGDVVEVIQEEFGITQAAVSQHLRVLRESGFATVRQQGAARLYCIENKALTELDNWLERMRGNWQTHLDKLDAEIKKES